MGAAGGRPRLLTALPSQALLEEIEQHGEKVEECQRLAKQYINAIKVRLRRGGAPSAGHPGRSPRHGQAQREGSGKLVANSLVFTGL